MIVSITFNVQQVLDLIGIFGAGTVMIGCGYVMGRLRSKNGKK